MANKKSKKKKQTTKSVLGMKITASIAGVLALGVVTFAATFGGLYPDATKALLKGEELYTQTQLDEATQTGYDNGFVAGLEGAGSSEPSIEYCYTALKPEKYYDKVYVNTSESVINEIASALQFLKGDSGEFIMTLYNNTTRTDEVSIKAAFSKELFTPAVCEEMNITDDDFMIVYVHYSDLAEPQIEVLFATHTVDAFVEGVHITCNAHQFGNIVSEDGLLMLNGESIKLGTPNSYTTNNIQFLSSTPCLPYTANK